VNATAHHLPPAPQSSGPVPTSVVMPLLRDLVGHLLRLGTALSELTALAGEKLTAIRRADSAALEQCAAREGALLQRVFREEGQRKAVLARLAQGLQCPDAERVRLTEIAARLPEPLASSLRARGAVLRDQAAELQQKNRLAAAVARNLQSHLRSLFAEVAGRSNEAPVYGPQGQQDSSVTRGWVDAVG
jgi:hypothetical protein